MDLEVTRDQDRARREARRHLRSWLLVCAVVVAPVCAPRESDSSYRTWSAYGGGPEQLRYASLNQINRDNVSQLEIAWIWDSRETGGLQTQPLVVDDLVFAYAPTHRTVAIDGATGQLRWTFDSGIAGQGPNRGLMYWADGAERRLFSAVDQYLYALDPATGAPVAGFGTDGRIDLHLGPRPAVAADAAHRAP